jgi:hypothetical protein
MAKKENHLLDLLAVTGAVDLDSPELLFWLADKRTDSQAR